MHVPPLQQPMEHDGESHSVAVVVLVVVVVVSVVVGG